MKIWANTIVNNEENFIWFAIMSVIDYVDKVLIYDTGSTDKTVQIIRDLKRIKKDKIIFKEVGAVNKNEFPKMRQAMLDESICDWVLILDGDEIWWEDSIKRVVEKIKQDGDKIEGIVVPMIVPVGDIYHYQDQSAGRYKILGRIGHYNLRFIRRDIPGLHVDQPYGKESYFDQNNLPIQQRKGVVFLNAPYLHVTHLKRSQSTRLFNKFKYELGRPFSKSFKFPEVLYLSYPDTISSPWRKMSGLEFIKAAILTPVRKFKRKLYEKYIW